MSDLLLLHRRAVIGILQISLVCFSLLLAWLLRFDFSLPYRSLLITAMPILVLIRLGAMAYFGLFRGWWKYAGVRDGIDILKAVGAGTVLFWVIMRFVLRATAFPRTVFVLEALLTAGLLVGVRLLSRVVAESVRENISPCKRVILIGAGSAAHIILREIRRPGSPYDQSESRQRVRCGRASFPDALSMKISLPRRALLEQLTGDDHPLNFVRALVNLRHLGVTIEALHF